jgi:hypothetical protein
MTIFAEYYDFSLSLLTLEDSAPTYHAEADAEPDAYDRFDSPARRREW